MHSSKIIIAKTWRSELLNLSLFGVFSLTSIWLSSIIPGSIITGPLFLNLTLNLPLFSLIPASIGLKAIYNIYNVRYTIDARGIESRVGILALEQRITKIRFEDIRSIETEQSLLERALGIGRLEVGTAATGEVEIILNGIAAPFEVQEMVQAERERRLRMKHEGGKTRALSETGQISSPSLASGS